MDLIIGFVIGYAIHYAISRAENSNGSIDDLQTPTNEEKEQIDYVDNLHNKNNYRNTD